MEATVATEGAGMAIMKVVEVVAMMGEVGVVIEVVLMAVTEGEMIWDKDSLLPLHLPLMEELEMITCRLQMPMVGTLIMELMQCLLRLAIPVLPRTHHLTVVEQVVMVVMNWGMQGVEFEEGPPLDMMVGMEVVLLGTKVVVMVVEAVAVLRRPLQPR